MCGYQMVTYAWRHKEKFYQEELCGLAAEDGKPCGEVGGWRAPHDYPVWLKSLRTGLVSPTTPPILSLSELTMSSPNSMLCIDHNLR